MAAGLLSFVLGSGAWAQTACGQTHAKQTWVSRYVEFLNPDFDRLPHQEMEQVLWEVHRLSRTLESGYFAIEESSGAAADLYRFELRFPAPEAGDPLKGVPSAYFGAFAHEAGHLIFEDSIKAQFWRDLHEKLDPREKRFLSPEEADLKAMMGAYHELFADMVSVVWSQNPKVISDSLNGDAARDFESPHFRHWRKSRNFSGEHLYFYPVRVAFWRAIKNRLNEPGFREKILPTAFRVLVADAEAHISEFSQDPKLIAEQNRRLAAALIRAFEHL